MKRIMLGLALCLGMVLSVFGDYSETKNVSSAAGTVVFGMNLAPIGGQWGVNGDAFSASWLTKPKPYSQNNNYIEITLAYTANTGASSRTATYTCKAMGHNVTLTVVQAGSGGGSGGGGSGGGGSGGGGSGGGGVPNLTKTISASGQIIAFTADWLDDVFVLSTASAADWILDKQWINELFLVGIAPNQGAQRSIVFTGYADSAKTSVVGTFTLVQLAADTVVPGFGPGNASKFYLSQNVKATVVGVYGLHWSSFVPRADGYSAFTDSHLVDREKGSGKTAEDHQWCWDWSWVDLCVWTGWAKKAGVDMDEDAFATTLLAYDAGGAYSSPMDFIEDRTGINLWDSILCPGSLSDFVSRFATADSMAQLSVYFDNYYWYGDFCSGIPGISHAVVCCGYALDTEKAVTDPTALKGLFIIDPDNDRETASGGTTAPDTMTYCPVSWDATNERFNILGIFGAPGYFYVDESCFLKTENSVQLNLSEESEPILGKFYSDTKNVSDAAGTVVFEMNLPSIGGQYGVNGDAFSASWLTKPKPHSQNNDYIAITLAFTANTGASSRTATYTCKANGYDVTLTIVQAGVTVPVPSTMGTATSTTEARTHEFGTVGEAVGRIEASPLGIPTQKKTYNAVVRDALGKPAGIVSVSVGKASNSGQCSVKATFIGLDGKKKNSNSVKVSMSQSGATHVTLFVKDYGTLELALGADSVAGTLGKYDVLPARVGGSLGTSRSSFNLENFNWTGSTKLLGDYLPTQEVFVSGSRWVFDKAAVVKYKQGVLDQAAYEKGLSDGKTNKSGLKLTYNARSGTFKGNFTVYSEDSSGQTAKLKKTRVTVTGVVADGYGYGQAVIRNGGTFPVAISPVR